MENKSVYIYPGMMWGGKITSHVKVEMKNKTFLLPLLPEELVRLHKEIEKPIEISGFRGDSSIFLYQGVPYNVITSYLHKTSIYTYGDKEDSVVDLSDSVVHLNYICNSVWEKPHHDVIFYNSLRKELLPFKFPKIILSEQSENRTIKIVIDDKFILPDIESFKELIKSAEESNTYIEFWMRDFIFKSYVSCHDFWYIEDELKKELRDYVIPKMKFNDYIDHLLELYRIAMKHENKKMNTIYRDYDDSYSMYLKVMGKLEDCKKNRRLTHLNRYRKQYEQDKTHA